MTEIIYTIQFKRDDKKRCRDSRLNALLKERIDALSSSEPLPAKFRDHPLKGGTAGCRDCHLQPDLFLIYVQTPNKLQLIRLGSHSELFV